jgi:hypothetical protein
VAAVSIRRFSGVFSGAVFGVCAAVAVAGCGHTARLSSGRTLGIALMEYRLRPSHVIAASGQLRIAVRNYGRLTHNFVIVRPTPTTTVATTPTGTVSYTTTVAARSPDLAPGQATTMTVTLPPGRYTLASTVDTDQPLGEQGTLTVTSR